MQSVVEEECTGNGALSCCVKGSNAGYEACIIPEPFNSSILRAQLGVMWFQVKVLGRPAHVLDTSAGGNAIEVGYIKNTNKLGIELIETNRIENR